MKFISEDKGKKFYCGGKLLEFVGGVFETEDKEVIEALGKAKNVTAEKTEKKAKADK